MLQCRAGKRTGKGAVKIATDMVSEGLVDTRQAVKMVEPQHLDQLLHPQVHYFSELNYKDCVVNGDVTNHEYFLCCSLRIRHRTRTA